MIPDHATPEKPRSKKLDAEVHQVIWEDGKPVCRPCLTIDPVEEAKDETAEGEQPKLSEMQARRPRRIAKSMKQHICRPDHGASTASGQAAETRNLGRSKAARPIVMSQECISPTVSSLRTRKTTKEKEKEHY